LVAIQQNKTIRVVKLGSFFFLNSSAIASFLKEAISLTSFAYRGDLLAAENDSGRLVLAEALQCHPRIQRLELNLTGDIDYTAILLKALGINKLCPEKAHAVARAIDPLSFAKAI